MLLIRKQLNFAYKRRFISILRECNGTTKPSHFLFKHLYSKLHCCSSRLGTNEFSIMPLIISEMIVWYYLSKCNKELNVEREKHHHWKHMTNKSLVSDCNEK